MLQFLINRELWLVLISSMGHNLSQTATRWWENKQPARKTALLLRKGVEEEEIRRR